MRHRRLSEHIVTRNVVASLSIGLLIVTTLLVPSTSIARWDDYMIIQPPHPTEADQVTIIVGGEWGDVCPPRYESHSIDGNTITIEAKAGVDVGELCCPWIATSWEFATNVGHLPIGNYTAVLRIRSWCGDTFRDHPPRFGHFVVSRHVYLPLVTKRLRPLLMPTPRPPTAGLGDGVRRLSAEMDSGTRR